MTSSSGLKKTRNSNLAARDLHYSEPFISWFLDTVSAVNPV